VASSDHRTHKDAGLMQLKRTRHLADGLLCMLVLLFGVLAVVPDADAALWGKRKKVAEQPPVFYPEPPETPRIQFLRTINSDKDVRAKTGRFRKFVLGEDESEEVLGKPYGIALARGKILVCDTARDYVVIFDVKGKAFGHLGESSPGRLKKPINIVVDKDGTRYVTDTVLKRVMVYDAENRYVRAIGDPEKMGPTDVAIHEDTLYVCDIDNAQVVVVDKKSGEELRRFGRKGSGKGEMFLPTNLVVDLDGNAYVSDTGNARVLKFDSHGNLLQQFGELGRAPGQLARPKGIALDREGRLYVVDAGFENVQIFDPDGTLLLFFGVAGNIPGGLNLPAKITIDYDNVDLFADRVSPDHELEYLVAVTSQFGLNKVNVYGFLKTGE
jgi:DNA-binding beta-propeller fold protein YncE